ncbi:MAG TPA: hypothetical protein VN493_22685 [Thermoanaerobaculia bacterium]|nr:hypothetical protein [Thermoanaerobaculia bacterium]
MRRSFTLVALLALSAVSAIPASAEVYTVILKNGNVLETQYQPQEASFDEDMVLLMSEVGNWIGVRRDEIESVMSDAESSGFGKVIAKNTVLLGWSANDAADPATQQAGQVDPAVQAMQNLYQQRQEQQSYTVKQFVSPNETQGIPAGLVGTYSAPPSQLPLPPLPPPPQQSPNSEQ